MPKRQSIGLSSNGQALFIYEPPGVQILTKKSCKSQKLVIFVFLANLS